jgi:hypothetical protein
MLAFYVVSDPKSAGASAEGASGTARQGRLETCMKNNIGSFSKKKHRLKNNFGHVLEKVLEHLWNIFGK